MPFDYEATALAGKLDAAQRQALIEAFAEDSNLETIVQRLNLPHDLVVEALSDETLITDALRLKRAAIGLRFVGIAYDALLALVQARDTRAAQRIGAIKLLGELLSTDLPTPTEGASSPDQGKARRKRGVGGRHSKKEPPAGTEMVATLRKLAGAGRPPDEDEDDDG